MSSADYSVLEQNARHDGDISGNADSSNDEEVAGPKSSTDDVPDGGFTAWMQVVAAFCINISTWGVINMYGVFQTHYTHYQLRHESQSNIAWIGSLQGGLLNLVCFLVGPIYDAGYSTELIWSGSFLTVLGMMVTSICVKHWQFLLAQGFVIGIGSGLCYLPGASIISQYFRRQRAFAFGIAAMGSSFGGIVFPIVFRQLEPRIGFVWTTRTFALIQFVMLSVPMIWMRPRIRAATPKRLLDWELLKDWPFFLFMIGMFFGYMGVYITYCYIELYAIQICHTSVAFASYILAVTNSGSIFGRVIPTYLSDRYMGPLNAHISFIVIATILAFSWIAIKDTVSLVIFCIFDGFFSGTFVSLGAPIVFSLTPELSIVGTRLGMLAGVVGMGLLIGTPIAGAILDRGSWIGLQIWAASLFLAAGFFISWARIAKYGAQVHIKA